MFTCKLMVSVLRLQLIHPRHTTRTGRAKLVVTCGLMRELLMYIKWASVGMSSNPFFIFTPIHQVSR